MLLHFRKILNLDKAKTDAYNFHSAQRLRELSDFLISEFNRESEHYWGKQNEPGKLSELLLRDFEIDKIKVLEDGKLTIGLRNPNSITRLRNQIKLIGSDPFIPDYLRKLLIEKLSIRIKRTTEALRIATGEIQKIIVDDGGKTVFEKSTFHNVIVFTLAQHGVGNEQNEKLAHELRRSIYEHFNFKASDRRV